MVPVAIVKGTMGILNFQISVDIIFKQMTGLIKLTLFFKADRK